MYAIRSYYVVQVTAHEVGHTLGFKHNFRGSDFLTPDEMNDVATVDARGQTASVMDYNPAIIASKGETQGHFLSPTLGPYDYWAVEYAYKPIEGDERAELARIAARGGDPDLPFSADEDARGAWATTSVDPYATIYRITSYNVCYTKLLRSRTERFSTTRRRTTRRRGCSRT